MKTIQQYKNDYLNQTKTEREEQLKTNNQLADNQKKQTQNIYNQKITETGESYKDLYRENEVDRLINERRIAENMANLGLTDSGLNRTQQTAVQLSYANQKGEIGRSKQKALDSLTSALATAITEIENKRISGQASINNTYAQNANTYAQKMYATDMEAETKRKAQEEETKRKKAALAAQQKQAAYAAQTAQANAKALESQAALMQSSYIIKANGGLLSRNYTGKLEDNGVHVIENSKNKNQWIYIDSNSGKQTTLNKDVNPYTGTVNKDTKNGTFSNGYQPNNIGGKRLSAVVGNDGEKLGFIVNGNQQTVWSYDGGKTLWVWYGKENTYRELK